MYLNAFCFGTVTFGLNWRWSLFYSSRELLVETIITLFHRFSFSTDRNWFLVCRARFFQQRNAIMNNEFLVMSYDWFRYTHFSHRTEERFLFLLKYPLSIHDNFQNMYSVIRKSVRSLSKGGRIHNSLSSHWRTWLMFWI